MSFKPPHTKGQIRDFVLYLSGSLILAFISIVRLPVFTSHFTPAEFGIFSLVSITYTYLSVVLYNWISSCLYRFYHEYTADGLQPALYSNIIFLFMASSIILLLVSIGWYFLAGNAAIRLLVIPAFCFLFTNQILSVFLVIYKLQGRALNYNLFQVLQAGFSLLLVLLLVFWAGLRIEAIFMGQIVINLILLGILTVKNRKFLKMVSSRLISPALIRKLVRYGFIGFVSSAGVFILVSSDRYIIALYEDISRVGLYNQVYQVGQVSVYFLVTVFFNTITPGFNKLLTDYTSENEKAFQNYINAFILLILPVTFYVSIFARQVSEFLLGPAFRAGYTMIPWIVISSFLYGLSLFNETKMKFEHRFSPVVWGVVIACTLNIALNFIFIPRLGYTWAAISTFIAYCFLFIFYYLKDDLHYLRNSAVVRIIMICALVLLTEGILDLLIRNMHVELNKWLTLLEGALFFAGYILVISRLKFIDLLIY